MNRDFYVSELLKINLTETAEGKQLHELSYEELEVLYLLECGNDTKPYF